MNRNIHNIKAEVNKIEILDCPQCKYEFETPREKINRSLEDKEKFIYCSEDCEKIHTLNSDKLGMTLINFYFENAKIPTLKDFKYTTSFKRKFGSWTIALRLYGLDFKLEPKLEPKKIHRNNWERQKDRHKKMKLLFIKKLGGCCSKCGYKDNWCSLSFHHVDPTLKTMGLDARNLGNRSLKLIEKELENCQLLCMNCHMSEHNPNGLIW